MSSAASERVARYLEKLSAIGTVEAEVWEQGLRAGARFHLLGREYEIEVNAAGGVDREEEVELTRLTPVDRP